jgi:muconolactone delta-isomerase
MKGDVMKFLMLKEDGPTPSLTADEMMQTLLDETDVLRVQIAHGQVDAIYKMVGRPGGALLVNADSHEALFRRLTELPEFGLSMFEIEAAVAQADARADHTASAAAR